MQIYEFFHFFNYLAHFFPRNPPERGDSGVAPNEIYAYLYAMEPQIIRFHWSPAVVWITIGGAALFIGLLTFVLMDETPSQLLKYALAGLLAAPLLSGLFIAPLAIRIGDEAIQIRRPVGCTAIPVGQIVSVQRVDFSEIRHAIRLFGSGGIFGYVGWFYNSRYGRFLMYATETDNLVLIRTADRSYIVSCRQPEPLFSLIPRTD